VLLLDEPFGALDAKIRVELRETVRAVQRRLGMTTILVTHDQEEAFALADRIGVMQSGRLLEIGTPEELYRHPATRFVARFLGAANMFLGEVSPQGLQLGSTTVESRQPARAGSNREVILVVRPEDIEVTTSEDRPHSRAFATGVVRGLTFAGHQQHVSVQLDAGSGVEPAVDEGHDGATLMTVGALRSAAEQQATPLVVGAAVSLGVRRVHALPTPISSFHLMAAGADGEALALDPLLAQLVRSMQARVIRHVEGDTPADRLDAGMCVLRLGTAAPAAIAAAVGQGARRIMCLPPDAPMPGRILVHAAEAADRGDLLALLSSVMRHLPVEATAVTPQRPEAGRGELAETQRLLADTRADLRGAHGLDLRVDRHVGDLRDWLAEAATHPEPALLVLGLPASATGLATTLQAELAPLFAPGARSAVLFAVNALP
jgi:sulfate transport system ATP-binding protein